MMTNNFFNEQEWQLKINDYCGPLDKLLELIKKNHMMILKFDLIEITSQYVKYVDDLLKNILSEKEINLISDYLYMAQYLITLKSRYLLKKELESNSSETNTLEIENDYLNNLLLTVQVYKDATHDLSIKQNERLLLFNKKSENFEQFLPNDFDYEKIPNKLNPNLFLQYLNNLDDQNDELEPIFNNYEIVNISSKKILDDILLFLKENKRIEFLQLVLKLYGKNKFFKSYLVISFIACLTLSNENKLKLFVDDVKLYIEFIKE